MPKAKPHDSFESRHTDSFSARITVQTAVRSLEQMCLLGHVKTKQRCEIQSVWNAWIQQRTQAEQEKHCVQRDSQKACVVKCG